jgi:hypothetical protein
MPCHDVKMVHWLTRLLLGVALAKLKGAAAHSEREVATGKGAGARPLERAGGYSDLEGINPIAASGVSRARTVRRWIASKAMMLSRADAIR